MDSDVQISSEVGHGSVVTLQPQVGVSEGDLVWQPPKQLQQLAPVVVSNPGSMLHEQLTRLGCAPRLVPDGNCSPKKGDVVIIDLSEEFTARADLAQALTEPLVITVGQEGLPGVSHVTGWPTRERVLAECLSAEQFDSLPTNRLKIRQLGGCVLIVDDSPLNRRLVAEFLALWGLEFREAPDGATAVKMWSEDHYDLIIMDCQMPVLDGLAATEEIRRREKPDEHVPILALTAHALATDAERCIGSGMDDYLAKPVIPEALRRKITQLLLSRQPKDGFAADSESETGPEATTVDETIWNRLIDLQYRSGDNLLPELLGLYQAQGQELTKKLREAVLSENQEAVQRFAHSLKGTAGSIGAARVVQLCKRIENCPKPSIELSEELDAAVIEAHDVLQSRLRSKS
jgi:CheY-like chemotaxis protein/HPt (histidine-containing phosphotransfer) domain-containing protein